MLQATAVPVDEAARLTGPNPPAFLADGRQGASDAVVLARSSSFLLAGRRRPGEAQRGEETPQFASYVSCIVYATAIVILVGLSDSNRVRPRTCGVRLGQSCFMTTLGCRHRAAAQGFLRTGISTTQTRLFAKWEDAQKGSSRVVRETRWAHGSKEALAAGGAAISSRAFADAESAAQALGAMAPACLDTFKVEVVEL